MTSCICTYRRSDGLHAPDCEYASAPTPPRNRARMTASASGGVGCSPSLTSNQSKRMKPTPKTRGILHKFLSENGRKGGSNFSEKKQAQFANLQKIRMANIAKKAILIGENHRKINLQKNED